MDTLALLVGILIGIISTRVYYQVKNTLELKTIENKVREKLAELKEKVINSRIDEMNGALYLYNTDTGEFLCQAATFPELEKVASTKFPGKLFNISPEQLKFYVKD